MCSYPGPADSVPLSRSDGAVQDSPERGLQTASLRLPTRPLPPLPGVPRPHTLPAPSHLTPPRLILPYLTPHTSHPHASYSHTSHLTPHTPHLTPHTSYTHTSHPTPHTPTPSPFCIEVTKLQFNNSDQDRMYTHGMLCPYSGKFLQVQFFAEITPELNFIF